MSSDEAPKRSKFRDRLEWIYKHRPDCPNITQLALNAGLAKGTITNQLKAAEARGEEPNYETKTLQKLAGGAQVSLSWLMGHGKDPDGPDKPPKPEIDPLDLARRRVGPIAEQLSDLRTRVGELERQLSLAKLKK